MKVKEFKKLLDNNYNDDDELYFSTSALECEFTFDKVTVYPKESSGDDTDVYLEFTDKHKKEFIEATAEDRLIDVREALTEIINRYL